MKHRHQWRILIRKGFPLLDYQQCVGCKAERHMIYKASGKFEKWSKAQNPETGELVGAYCDSTYSK